MRAATMSTTPHPRLSTPAYVVARQAQQLLAYILRPFLVTTHCQSSLSSPAIACATTGDPSCLRRPHLCVPLHAGPLATAVFVFPCTRTACHRCLRAPLHVGTPPSVCKRCHRQPYSGHSTLSSLVSSPPSNHCDWRTEPTPPIDGC